MTKIPVLRESTIYWRRQTCHLVTATGRNTGWGNQQLSGAQGRPYRRAVSWVQIWRIGSCSQVNRHSICKHTKSDGPVIILGTAYPIMAGTHSLCGGWARPSREILWKLLLVLLKSLNFILWAESYQKGRDKVRMDFWKDHWQSEQNRPELGETNRLAFWGCSDCIEISYKGTGLSNYNIGMSCLTMKSQGLFSIKHINCYHCIKL